MKIEQVSVGALIPHSANNLKHPDSQVDRIASAIEQFGFNVPLVVNKSNVVIAGHGRLLAAKKLGLKDVPCVRADHLTAAQERAWRILDNSIPREAEWDFDALKLEFSLMEEDGFDFERWGIDDLIPKDFGEEATDDEYEAGPLDDIETIVKVGDLIELGEQRLFCGDSTNPEHVAELFNGAKPFMMVTDPPYGVEYDPTWRDNAGGQFGDGKTKMRGKVQNDERVNWTAAYELFPGDVAYVWHASYYTIDVGQNLRDAKFAIRSSIIWRKPHFIMSRGHYHWQHEPAWYAVREGKTSKWCGDRSQSTIWDIKGMNPAGGGKEAKTVHGTQKPLECMARPIRNHGGKDDAVYDPFLGSGTTLIACEQLGRTCYGMELEPKYCQVIIDRYHKYCRDNGKEFRCMINGEPYEPIENTTTTEAQER